MIEVGLFFLGAGFGLMVAYFIVVLLEGRGDK